MDTMTMKIMTAVGNALQVVNYFEKNKPVEWTKKYGEKKAKKMFDDMLPGLQKERKDAVIHAILLIDDRDLLIEIEEIVWTFWDRLLKKNQVKNGREKSK